METFIITKYDSYGHKFGILDIAGKKIPLTMGMRIEYHKEEKFFSFYTFNMDGESFIASGGGEADAQRIINEIKKYCDGE